MTKRNLLLGSLLLVLGLGTASSLLAQATGVVFNGSNNTNYYIRHEGDAEGVGTISLSTRSTGTIKAGSAWYITYNAPLAANGTLYAVSVSCTGDFADDVCSNIQMSVLTAAFSSQPPEAVQGTPTKNQIALTFTSDTVLGTPSIGTQINIAARVMAQGLPYGYGVYATVRAYFQFSQYPMTVSPLYPAPYEVAEVATTQALTTSVGDYNFRQESFVPGPEYVLTCLGVHKINGTAYDSDFELLISENWPNALTSLSDEDFLEQYPPPAEYYVSNGPFQDPAPTNGSNILITLYHIPTGVTVEGRTPYPCQDFSSSSSNYCENGDLVIESPLSSDVTTGTDGLGVQSFWYAVDNTNTSVQEGANFGFMLWSDGPLPPNTPAMTAQIMLTDAETSDGPVNMPYFTYPETPIVTVVQFNDCVTKLLFPYVNGYVGGGKAAFSNFGTGINVANTTTDPFANMDKNGNLLYPDEAPGTAQPQSGSCTFYFYPWNAGVASVYMTPTIPTGGSYAFDVGSLGSLTGVPATLVSGPKFIGNTATGYAIAICDFQNAHGFAEIYDNYGLGDPTATLAYIADVLPDPAFYPRSPAGSGLGEGAIAPVNMMGIIRELLLYGPGALRK